MVIIEQDQFAQLFVRLVNAIYFSITSSCHFHTQTIITIELIVFAGMEIQRQFQPPVFVPVQLIK